MAHQTAHPTDPMRVDSPSNTSTMSVDESIAEFFRSSPPPDDLEQIEQDLKEFVDFHMQQRRRIVLVTVSSTLPSFL